MLQLAPHNLGVKSGSACRDVTIIFPRVTFAWRQLDDSSVATGRRSLDLEGDGRVRRQFRFTLVSCLVSPALRRWRPRWWWQRSAPHWSSSRLRHLCNWTAQRLCRSSACRISTCSGKYTKVTPMQRPETTLFRHFSKQFAFLPNGKVKEIFCGAKFVTKDKETSKELRKTSLLSWTAERHKI